MATKKLGEFATPNDDYLHAPITQPAVVAEKYEIKPNLLNLIDRKSTRLNSSHRSLSRMPSSA